MLDQSKCSWHSYLRYIVGADQMATLHGLAFLKLYVVRTFSSGVHCVMTEVPQVIK